MGTILTAFVSHDALISNLTDRTVTPRGDIDFSLLPWKCQGRFMHEYVGLTNLHVKFLRSSAVDLWSGWDEWQVIDLSNVTPDPGWLEQCEIKHCRSFWDVQTVRFWVVSYVCIWYPHDTIHYQLKPESADRARIIAELERNSCIPKKLLTNFW